MVNEELINYIKSQLAHGFDKDLIKKKLLQSSWQEADIEKAFILINVRDSLSTRDEKVSLSSLSQKTASQPTIISSQIIKPHGKKIPIVLGVLFFFIIIMAGIIISYVNIQKNELKSLSRKNVTNISRLDATYNSILETIKSSGQEENGGKEASLLSFSLDPETSYKKNKVYDQKTQVLGLEESPAIIQMRKMGDYYNQGKNIITDIKNTNNLVKNKTQTFPNKFFLPNSTPITKETETFIEKSEFLINYLEQTNKLEIRLVTTGYDIGIAFKEVVNNQGDLKTIQNMENKVKTISEIEEQYKAINTNSLPEDLKQMHIKNIESFEKTKNYFDEITAYFKKKDMVGLVNTLQSFSLLAEASGEIGKVEMVSFWQQDQSIKSVKKIKNEWESFGNSF